MNLFGKTIDPVELIGALWKNILAIALAAALCGSAAFAYTVFMVSPQYNATVSMYINNAPLNFGSASLNISAGQINTSNSLASIYIYILKSRTTMEEVIKEANLTYSPTAVGKMISAQSVSGTGALEVTVTGGDPFEVELIANTVAKVLPDRVAEIVDGTSIRIVDYAIIPSRRSGPNLVRETEKGILAGAVLSAGLVLLFTILHSQSGVMVQSADELRAMFPDITTLAQIPDMRRNDRKGYYSSYYYTDKEKKGGRKSGKKH